MPALQCQEGPALEKRREGLWESLLPQVICASPDGGASTVKVARARSQERLGQGLLAPLVALTQSRALGHGEGMDPG
jgi:hypothetical protein